MCPSGNCDEGSRKRRGPMDRARSRRARRSFLVHRHRHELRPGRGQRGARAAVGGILYPDRVARVRHHSGDQSERGLPATEHHHLVGLASPRRGPRRDRRRWRFAGWRARRCRCRSGSPGAGCGRGARAVSPTARAGSAPDPAVPAGRRPPWSPAPTASGSRAAARGSTDRSSLRGPARARRPRSRPSTEATRVPAPTRDSR